MNSVQAMADSPLKALIEEEEEVWSANLRARSAALLNAETLARPDNHGESFLSPDPSVSIKKGNLSEVDLPEYSSRNEYGLDSCTLSKSDGVTNLGGMSYTTPPPSYRSHVSSKERKIRMADLARETKAIHKDLRTSQAPRFTFRTASSTDLLFLIDCTFSMRPYIEAVKRDVSKIVEDITKAFYNDAVIRVGVVTYRDHGQNPNVEALDFTTDIKEVVSFLARARMRSGHDWSEDVLGGLVKALDMSWKQETRCIIHIGDAPPHGQPLQNIVDKGDRYAVPGSEPHKLTYKPLVKRMLEFGINYILLPVNNHMEKMAYLFAWEYIVASAGAKLPRAHAYYELLKDRQNKHILPQIAAASQLMCIVAEIGTVATELNKLVVKNVLESASRTAVRTFVKHTAKAHNVSSDLAIIEEDELETTLPNWQNSSLFPVTADMEGFCADIIVQDNKTLRDMLSSDSNIRIGAVNLTIHLQSQPFAKGALRFAHYGRTLHSETPYVFKSFQTGGKPLAYLVEDMKVQALCRAFALEFNAAIGHEDALDFIVTVSLVARHGTGTRYSLERFLVGEYVKYNNNVGWVLPETEANRRMNHLTQAFSHFTFEISRGEFLVCDLQGVGNVLTDPTIHTKDVRRFLLTETNFNLDGFKYFFATHECNEICSKLQLKSQKHMILTNSYSFRDVWPSVYKTACCSNKLCGKVVKPALAHKVEQYPGFSWCDICWPQIAKTTLTLSCDGKGEPFHDFEESAFFFESQGRGLPRRCDKHREPEERVRPSGVSSVRGFIKSFSLTISWGPK